MQPFFSIIIPTYNSALKIANCLSSIEKQRFRDYEVIVIDGQSEDNTCDIVETFVKKNLRIKLFSERDSGIYDAMNKGLKYSGGKWLFFLGSDDLIFDDMVMHDVAEIIPRMTSSVIYGNVRIKGETIWAEDGIIYDGKFELKKLLHKNICHQAIFYNSEFVKRQIISFNTNYRICSDWDFNMRCWQKTKFEFYDRIITNYSGGGLSASNSKDVQFENDFKQNIEKYFGRKALKLRYSGGKNNYLLRAKLALEKIFKAR